MLYFSSESKIWPATNSSVKKEELKVLLYPVNIIDLFQQKDSLR